MLPSVDAPATVTDAVRLLEREGYDNQFDVTGPSTRCHGCDTTHGSAQLVVRRTFRFEGPTDPGDEAIVLGVECPACGTKGIVVSAYGPDADRELIELVKRLR